MDLWDRMVQERLQRSAYDGTLAADGGKLLINGIDMEKEPKKALSQIGIHPGRFRRIR